MSLISKSARVLANHTQRSLSNVATLGLRCLRLAPRVVGEETGSRGGACDDRGRVEESRQPEVQWQLSCPGAIALCLRTATSYPIESIGGQSFGEGHRESDAPRCDFWLEFSPPGSRFLLVQNNGAEPAFDAVVFIPANGSNFKSDVINRLDNDRNWIPCTLKGNFVSLESVRGVLAETVLRSSDNGEEQSGGIRKLSGRQATRPAIRNLCADRQSLFNLSNKTQSPQSRRAVENGCRPREYRGVFVALSCVFVCVFFVRWNLNAMALAGVGSPSTDHPLR
jgi:hypothetical protein